MVDGSRFGLYDGRCIYHPKSDIKKAPYPRQPKQDKEPKTTPGRFCSV